MIILAAALIGIVTGAVLARRRGGRPADMAQYAAGYGIAFTLAGLFLTILIERML